VLLMGIYPSLFLDPMAASVDHLLAQAARQPAASTAAALAAR
jgi:NADH:ubiquinone oxidoreductase subunit 4 (subunit M)